METLTDVQGVKQWLFGMVQCHLKYLSGLSDAFQNRTKTWQRRLFWLDGDMATNIATI